MNTQRRLLVEWLLICLLVPIAVLSLCHCVELPLRLDLALYDQLMARTNRAPSPDILIIGIDQRSLRKLGPWPWPQAIHAQLLNIIAPHAPRSVTFDLPPATPDRDDPLLQDAMRKVPVYLSLRTKIDVSREMRAFKSTPPLLAQSACDIGHADALPPVDGIVRRIERHAGPPDAPRPYVGLLVAGENPSASKAEPRCPAARDGAENRGNPPTFGFVIAGPMGTYPSVSYVNVLRGEVPPEMLRGRDVLLGALPDSGLNDDVTVMVGQHPQRLSHVELQANAIDTLRHGREISPVSDGAKVAWIALPVWLALALFLRMPRHAWAGALVLGTGCIALSVTLLVFAQTWMGPAAPLAGIAAAYLLWSWRRFSALHHFFLQRVTQLNAIPSGAFELMPPATPLPANAIDRQTAALDHAILRLTHLQSLIGEGLWQLPQAVLVCRADGTIGQSNAAARELLLNSVAPSSTLVAADPLVGANLLEMFARMASNERAVGRPAPVAPSSWADANGQEYVTAHRKEFRVQAAAIDGTRSNWVVALRDMSAQYQRERDYTRWLSFMSHDMRSPQVSILSLLALHAERAQGMDEARLVEGVRREAERTLALAEGLVDVAEALSDDYRLEGIELGSVVLDAIEQAAPYAAVRQVRLVAPTPGAHDCPVFADGALLQRALLNILNNAIRHSPGGGVVRVCLEASFEEMPMGVVAVRDEGDGMSADRLAQVRTAARHPRDRTRGRSAGAPPVQRRGLGMSLVHAVIERHGGWIDAHSTPAAGTTLLIGLPLRA